ncbi:MAG TPA: 3-methyl-2-oxobutanoate hydroxymethyltransferase [Methylomirabilota bacterium]|nr:3-methyl-2-oxobutanoate hydroxymethyltransferase [Methylomirabilota bacterium]
MRVTGADLKEMKGRGELVPVLTAYDAPTARILDDAGIPVLLVGDSLGMVVLGYENTTRVSMEEMLHHTKAVVRASRTAMVVADMPFLSTTVSVEQSIENAARFIRDAGAQAVKVEGGERVVETARRIVDAGIPVMGHLGLTPQQVLNLGGYKVQGRSGEAAEQILKDALALERAGIFSIVLECIPAPLAKLITKSLAIPTIGIGAGPDCDGQVQVIHDILGLSDFFPKHVKLYARLGDAIKQAAKSYQEEVKNGQFPTEAHSFTMDESVIRYVEDQLAKDRQRTSDR